MPSVPAPLSSLPDARWRPLTTDDIPAYVRLMEAARVTDGEEEVVTAEIAGHHFENPRMPRATNTLALASPDGTLHGYSGVDERAGASSARRAFVWGRTDPAFRGRGIGNAVFGWATARAVEIVSSQPADVPRLIETWADVRNEDAAALFEAHGFLPVRWYFDMRRLFDEPLPAPIDTSPIRIIRYSEAGGSNLGEQIRLVHNDAFADHWGSGPIQPADWQREFVGHPYFRPDLSVLALDGDEIAAYSANYVSEADWAASGIREGWVGQLGVRRAWRRRGLATALLVVSMELFKAAGLEAAILGVDTENPSGAVGIYERVGFRPIRRSVRFRKTF